MHEVGQRAFIVALLSGLLLGFYADTPAAPMPALLHAGALALLVGGAAAGWRRVWLAHWPWWPALVLLAVLAALVLVLPHGSKAGGYGLFLAATGLVVGIIGLVERRP